MPLQLSPRTVFLIFPIGDIKTIRHPLLVREAAQTAFLGQVSRMKLDKTKQPR
jgi:hypothetical protein